MRRLTYLAPVALCLIAACAGGSNDVGDSDDMMPSDLTAMPMAQINHGLRRNGSSTLSVRTLPNAVCTLRPANEAKGAAEHLRVLADDQGVARIHLQDNQGRAQTAQLALDCADESGKSLTHAVNLTVGDGLRGQLPALYAQSATAPRMAAIAGDPNALSADAVAAHGLPPRPDAAAAPAQYQRWLEMANKRPAIMTPHVRQDTRSHGPARLADGTSLTRDPSGRFSASGTSNNWSGMVIATGGSAPQYGEIFGAWPVPRAYAQSGFWHLNHSSFWVGIDGWGTPDVVQAGTDQDTETVFWVQASSYGAWTEWYPLSSKSISNFPVNPGDLIYCWVWVGNSAGAWTPSGGVGWFLLWNVTQNVATPHLSTAAPSGTVFNGHQAEWVMERPTVNGSLSTLANYSTASMTDAWAYDFANQAHYYTSDYSVGLSMTGSSGVLSTVAPVNSMAMQFTWHNYN